MVLVKIRLSNPFKYVFKMFISLLINCVTYNVFPVNAELLLVSNVQLIMHSTAYIAYLGLSVYSYLLKGKEVIVCDCENKFPFALVFLLVSCSNHLDDFHLINPDAAF